MNHKNLIILRKTIQIISFLIFILTIAVAVYPFKAYFFTKLFLIIDPLNAIGTQTATGRFNPIMLLSLPLLLSPILFGRAFCGWICPLGTTIDLTDNILGFVKFSVEILDKNKKGTPNQLWKGGTHVSFTSKNRSNIQ